MQNLDIPGMRVGGERERQFAQYCSAWEHNLTRDDRDSQWSLIEPCTMEGPHTIDLSHGATATTNVGCQLFLIWVPQTLRQLWNKNYTHKLTNNNFFDLLISSA